LFFESLAYIQEVNRDRYAGDGNWNRKESFCFLTCDGVLIASAEIFYDLEDMGDDL